MSSCDRLADVQRTSLLVVAQFTGRLIFIRIHPYLQEDTPKNGAGGSHCNLKLFVANLSIWYKHDKILSSALMAAFEFFPHTFIL